MKRFFLVLHDQDQIPFFVSENNAESNVLIRTQNLGDPKGADCGPPHIVDVGVAVRRRVFEKCANIGLSWNG